MDGNTYRPNKPKPRKLNPGKRKYTVKNSAAVKLIVDEVEKDEDIVPRRQELLLSSPEGTRVFVRIRRRRTLD